MLMVELHGRPCGVCAFPRLLEEPKGKPWLQADPELAPSTYVPGDPNVTLAGTESFLTKEAWKGATLYSVAMFLGISMYDHSPSRLPVIA